MIINKVDELALAIVSSSSSDLSIDDKIKLYLESRTAILEHNKPFVDEENTNRQGNFKAFKRSF